MSHLQPTDLDDVAKMLAVAFEEGDAKRAAKALGDFARSQRTMAQIAKDTGLSRENLYRSLRGDERIPNLHTVMKVLKALGFRLSVVPDQSSKPL